MSLNYSEGEIILVNKPYKWTSFDVVNKIRCTIRIHHQIKKIKIGHAGTLDPLATGLLIICTGKFTKRINEFQDSEKEYTGIMQIGATTPSSDLETKIDQEFDFSHITDDQIYETAKKFTGIIQQNPPLFSAKKIDGERAYEKARRGENMIVKSVEVNISRFEITKIKLPNIHFRVICSKGTYIRSLVRDFGVTLNNGAHLIELCRIRSGSFNLDEAKDIDSIYKNIVETGKNKENLEQNQI